MQNLSGPQLDSTAAEGMPSLEALPIKFSIVINNYNYGQFLGQTLDSCLKQTYPAYEIIVVDDGSTDCSREVLKLYEGNPLIRIIYQENQGQEYAIQRGFDEVTGDWVFGLDSDDYYFPNCLEEVARRIGPDCSWVYFRSEVIDANGISWGLQPRPKVKLLEGNLAKRWFYDQAVETFPPQSFHCFSRAFTRSIRRVSNPCVNLSNGLAPDIYLMIEAAFHGTVAAIDMPLGVYREHAKGESKRNHGSFQRAKGKMGAYEIRNGLIAERLRQHAFPPKEEPYYVSAQDYWEIRLLSFLIDRANHPYPGDHRSRLLRQALSSLWKSKNLAWDSRLFKGLKNVLMTVLPQQAWAIYNFKPRRQLHFGKSRGEKVLARIVARFS